MIALYPITSFTFLGLNLSVHGLFMALGALTGWIATRHPARERKLDPQILENVITIAVIAGIIGARIGYIMIFGRDMSLYQMFAIWEGGSVSHAGYLFGVGACIAYLKWKRQQIAVWADVLAPAAVLGWAVGRIGDFISWGEFGVPSNLPWAVSAFGTPRHPTQIYESLAYLIVFLLSQQFGKLKAVKSPGAIAIFTIAGFASARFCIDFLRADPIEYRLLSQGFTAMLVVLVVVYLLWKKRKQDGQKW